jgi:hypothetical protein
MVSHLRYEVLVVVVVVLITFTVGWTTNIMDFCSEVLHHQNSLISCGRWQDYHRTLWPERTPSQIGTTKQCHQREVPRKWWISHTHPMWLWRHSLLKIPKVTLRPTVSRCLGVRHSFGTSDQFFFLLEIFFTVAGLLFCSALSDERTGLKISVTWAIILWNQATTRNAPVSNVLRFIRGVGLTEGWRGRAIDLEGRSGRSGRILARIHYIHTYVYKNRL